MAFRNHGFLGVRDLRRRSGQFVLKNHLRLKDGTLASLDELRSSAEFQGLERSEQRRYERAAKDGATLSETEGNAIVNPETGKVTDDFARQEQTLETSERLNRALESQGMKEQAEEFNKAERERFERATAPAEPVAYEDAARAPTSSEGGVDEQYIERAQLESTTSEEADILVSMIEDFYPPAQAVGGN
jgi:hypothetical protein